MGSRFSPPRSSGQTAFYVNDQKIPTEAKLLRADARTYSLEVALDYFKCDDRQGITVQSNFYAGPEDFVATFYAPLGQYALAHLPPNCIGDAVLKAVCAAQHCGRMRGN